MRTPSPTTPMALATVVATALATGCGPASGNAPAPEPPTPRPVDAGEKDDFNGDGFDDLVITVPGAEVGGRVGAGYIAVVYGAQDGLDTGDPQVVSEEADWVPGEPGELSNFGSGAVTGDFDGDGFADLAIGRRTEESTATEAVLLWGGEAGLGEAASVVDRSKDLGMPTAGGDFNGDGHQDLLTFFGDGLRLLYGPFSRDGGAADTASEALPNAGESFSFITGDVTGDGATDVFGFESFEEMAYPTRFWRGTGSGLQEASADLPNADEGVVADVDGDGYGDLVLRLLGMSVEDPPHVPSTIMVVHGGEDGPSTDRRPTLTLDSEGVPGEEADGDQFGFELTAGDVDSDGYADVAAGVNTPDGRALVLLKGGQAGLTGAEAQRYGRSESDAPVPENPDAGNGLDFGSPWTRLRTLDANGDGAADIAVGGPQIDSAGVNGLLGPVWAFSGAEAGLTGMTAFTLAFIGAPSGPKFGNGQSFAD
ncbi:MAG: VCBS repeat-containing protein [Nocardiopsaceae bacterium]|nr:VCBS repeat-containing protein [Nocardiopsaceae bacterium]